MFVVPAWAVSQQAVFGSSEQPERDTTGFGHFPPRAPESEFHNYAPSHRNHVFRAKRDRASAVGGPGGGGGGGAGR
ncbi:hypothetical protein, partial [Nocardia asiatica]|uniref:hypothetical protein n=1 Tax=Nocardia asiatica TaxID=209252 RepID=UPI00245416E7